MTKSTKPSRQSMDAKAQRVIDTERVAKMMAIPDWCTVEIREHCRTVLGWSEDRFRRALNEVI